MKFNILPTVIIWIVFIILSVVTLLLCIFILKYDNMNLKNINMNLIIYSSCVSFISVSFTMFAFILHLCSLKRTYRHTQLDHAELI